MTPSHAGALPVVHWDATVYGRPLILPALWGRIRPHGANKWAYLWSNTAPQIRPCYRPPSIDRPAPTPIHRRTNQPKNSAMQQAESEYTLEGDLYFCNVCPRARGAKSWKVHARKPAHQTNLRRRDELRQRTAPAPPQPASDAAYEQRVWARLTALMSLNNGLPGPDNNPRSLDADIVALHARDRALPPSASEQPDDAPNIGHQTAQGSSWPGIIATEATAIVANKDNPMGGQDTPEAPEPPIIRIDKRSDRVDMSAWYPFKNKMA
ncbi:hypothetical protein PtA15_8A674 [Puccinia triticina]|uniref:U1-type domain-containing protein n=1 Tax=Puccinia triticina TaxID=208348 RepID=A0ABY7CS55_9BASI|nr:uncharacterized protein PtA15_8A674 [Puccinia triticina]WAQ87768.1 hypothetical protein PtA15_8A674 [Puccinia triticina]